MNGFQNHLNEAMAQNTTGQQDDGAPPEARWQKKKGIKAKKPLFPFSWKYFFLPLMLFMLLGGVFLAYLWLIEESINRALVQKLPLKTVLITQETTRYTANATTPQPVVRMGSEAEAQKNPDKNLPEGAKGLYEYVDGKSLPVIRQSDGMSVYRHFQKPFTASNKPALSIVLVDAGLKAKETENLIQDLPSNVTFSFSAYARNLDSLVALAKDKGHEIWLDFPLQPASFPVDDAGPLSILSEASVQQNTDRLYTLFSKTQGYVGLITPDNTAFKRSEAQTNPVFKDLFQRGLAVLETTPAPFLDRLAKAQDYPYGQGVFWLDERMTPLSMNQNLRQALEYAQARGKAALLLRPYPASVDALKKFLNSQVVRTVDLAPLSYYVKPNE